jgi:hypothetical protein
MQSGCNTVGRLAEQKRNIVECCGPKIVVVNNRRLVSTCCISTMIFWATQLTWWQGTGCSVMYDTFSIWRLIISLRSVRKILQNNSVPRAQRSPRRKWSCFVVRVDTYFSNDTQPWSISICQTPWILTTPNPPVPNITVIQQSRIMGSYLLQYRSKKTHCPQ